MNCNDYQNEIILLHAGELPSERKAALDLHLQLCRECMDFHRDIMGTVAAVQEGSLDARAVNLWPRVAERISARKPLVPRWALVPVLSFLLLGTVITKTVFRMQPTSYHADIEIVKDLDFLTDYDLWDDLDTLEHMDVAS